MVLDLVYSNRLRYYESSFADKRVIIEEVINTIKIKGGRFVQLKYGVWSIVLDSQSCLKIAAAISYHIRMEFAQSKGVSSNRACADTATLKLLPEKPLSDHDRVEKMFRLQNRPTPRAQYRSHYSTINHLAMYNLNQQSYNMARGITVPHAGKAAVVHDIGLVTPDVPKLVQLPEFNQFMDRHHLSTVSIPKHPPITMSVPNARQRSIHTIYSSK
jgi:hypothetical protein